MWMGGGDGPQGRDRWHLEVDGHRARGRDQGGPSLKGWLRPGQDMAMLTRYVFMNLYEFI